MPDIPEAGPVSSDLSQERRLRGIEALLRESPPQKRGRLSETALGSQFAPGGTAGNLELSDVEPRRTVVEISHKAFTAVTGSPVEGTQDKWPGMLVARDELFVVSYTPPDFEYDVEIVAANVSGVAANAHWRVRRSLVAEAGTLEVPATVTDSTLVVQAYGATDARVDTLIPIDLPANDGRLHLLEVGRVNTGSLDTLGTNEVLVLKLRLVEVA